MAKRMTLSPILKPFWSSWDDYVLALALVRVVHDGIVERRVEGLSHGLYLRDAQPGQYVLELGHYHFDALAVGLVGGGLLERAHEVVVHGQELGHSVAGRTSLKMLSRSLCERLR